MTNLLPVSGSGVFLMVWAATSYVSLQLRHRPVVKTSHTFVAFALLVVSIRGTMNVVLALRKGDGLKCAAQHPPCSFIGTPPIR